VCNIFHLKNRRFCKKKKKMCVHEDRLSNVKIAKQATYQQNHLRLCLVKASGFFLFSFKKNKEKKGQPHKQ
jgi:hypothetical protein